MKTLLILLMITAALQGCTKHCFQCRDEQGTPAGEECFKSAEDQDVWLAGQRATNPNGPTKCD